MKNLLSHFILFTLILFTSITIFYFYGKDIWYPYYKKITSPIKEKKIMPKEKNSTNTTLEVSPTEEPSTPIKENLLLDAKKKLHRHLADANFIIYPTNLTLIGLKYEKRLEVWTKKNKEYIHIVDYPFTAFSGILGPKFKEGDRQIPEGIYDIEYLNPNSKFHLSMKISYPNDFDKTMAKKEHRTNLGSNIMIHGSNRTIGCIPIGDEAIEELYFLVQKVGIKNVKVILSPVDFRVMDVAIKNNEHPWIKELYRKIKKEMKPFTSK